MVTSLLIKIQRWSITERGRIWYTYKSVHNRYTYCCEMKIKINVNVEMKKNSVIHLYLKDNT